MALFDSLFVTGRLALAAAALMASLVLSACGESGTNTYVEPPPSQVDVAKPMIESVSDYLQFTGTTVASGRVDVRARVGGDLREMLFTPGTTVAAGERLFQIDPREYQADLQAAEAELASARAQFEQARTELNRAERLFSEQAGSEATVVEWQANKSLAEAAIQRAEAQIQRAQLNLDYTNVRAPIAGRVGRNLVDLGALVGETDATVLTEVTQYDPMYVYFDLNERDLLRAMKIYKANIEKRGIDPSRDSVEKAQIPVSMGIADEEGFPHEGILDYAASGVDTTTGTMRLRGSFPNPEQPPALIPGLFARVRFPIGVKPDMPLVTERSIGADQSGRYVLVVNAENVVEKRNVELGSTVDGLRVVEDGLGPEDRVVVRGVLRARPGAQVAPSEVDMASMRRSVLAESLTSD